jgi:hypothetical protein
MTFVEAAAGDESALPARSVARADIEWGPASRPR